MSPTKKVLLGNTSFRLDIDYLKIEEEGEELILLSESQKSNVKFSMHIDLIIKE